MGDILLWAYSVGATPGSVEQSGVFVGLSSRRSRVQIPSFPLTEAPPGFGLGGQVAQSVERRSEKPEVDGSTPSLTTIPLPGEMPKKGPLQGLSLQKLRSRTLTPVCPVFATFNLCWRRGSNWPYPADHCDLVLTNPEHVMADPASSVISGRGGTGVVDMSGAGDSGEPPMPDASVHTAAKAW